MGEQPQLNVNGTEMLAHTPEQHPFLARLVFFGFVLKEAAAKRLKNLINQKARHPEREMIYSFHYML